MPCSPQVRSEWHRLPDDQKGIIFTGIQQLLQQFIATSPPPAAPEWPRLPPGVKRLALAEAAAAVRSRAAADGLVREALEKLAASSGATGVSPAVGVELLTCLPQEVLEQERGGSGSTSGTPAESRPELRAQLPRVLEAMQVAISQPSLPQGSAPFDDRVAACMRCWQHWLSLQTGPSLLLTVDSLPSLLEASFYALAASNDALNMAAADALVELFSASNTVLDPSKEKAVATTRLVAERMQGLAQALNLAAACRERQEV